MSSNADRFHASSSSRTNQGRRAACDRCRGQKLRCLLEGSGGASDTGRCSRCNTAQAVCSFSPSKRAGRPPASASTGPTEQRQRGKDGKRSGVSTRGTQSGNSKISRQDAAKTQSERIKGQRSMGTTSMDDELDLEAGNANSAEAFITQPLTNSSIHNSSWDSVADLSWIDESNAASYDRGNFTNLDSFVHDFGWSIPTTTSDETQTNQTPDIGLFDNLSTLHFKTSDDVISKSSPTTCESKHRDFAGERVRDRQSVDLGGANFNAKPRKHSESDNGVSSERPLLGNHAQHQRTQELSDLAMSLYTQLVANEEYHRAQNSNRTPGLRQELVGSILKSSAAFLDILTSFYIPTSIKHARPETSVFDSSGGEVSPSEASMCSSFSDFTTIMGPDDRRQSHAWKRIFTSANLSTSGNINSREDSKALAADVTTVLQLLTCYIRIIHLHSIFYTQVHNCLTAPPHKRELYLPPLFPGMHVGGVPLDNFRIFQIKLILQISTHILGEIETTLGLPDGCRISKKSPQTQGILEASVSVQFVEVTMRENGRAGLVGIGRDHIKSIRDKLGSLRELLKGTINI